MKWLIPILCLIMIPAVSAISNYSDWTYGSGHYGVNTPPTILEAVPSGATLSLEPPISQDFNITFIDYDGDTVVIEWYVDNNLNTSNQNLTYDFSQEATYNITANLSDGMDRTQRDWIVTIEIILINANISDALIVPSITNLGSLFIVKANVSAIDKNITGSEVYAHLNVDEDVIFLTQTPQNQSIGNLWTTNVTEVSWIITAPFQPKKEGINITYNTNNQTYYGENKNIFIKRQENLMGLEIILVMIFIIALYVYLIRYFTIELFSEHGGIKMLFLLGAFWLLLVPLSIANQFNVFNGGPAGVSNLLDVVHIMMLAVNTLISMYLIMWFLVKVSQKMAKRYKSE